MDLSLAYYSLGVTIRAYPRNLGQHSILARKGTFYEKRTLFFNKGHQLPPPVQSLL